MADWVGPLSQVAGATGSMIAGSRASAANLKAGKRAAEQRLINADIEAGQVQRHAKRVLSKQQALTGAAGIAQSGTPMEVMLDTAMQAELEKELIKRGATMEGGYDRYRGALASRRARGEIASGVNKFATLFNDRQFKSILQDLVEQAQGPGAYRDTGDFDLFD